MSTRSGISKAINTIYGQIEGESADSILQEFTDTTIDFTETVVAEDMDSSCFVFDDEDDTSLECGDDAIIFGAVNPEHAQQRSEEVAGADRKRLKPHPAVERLVDIMLIELCQLKGSQLLLRLLEGAISVEYGIEQRGKIEFTQRDHLPRRQWKSLVVAIAARAPFVENEDGRRLPTLTWKAEDGRVVTFNVRIDEDAGIVELTVVS